MAVYQAVRMATIASTLPRRRQPARRRAARGASRVGLSLAAILVAFLLGLFYLTQTIGAAASSYDIDTLMASRDHLDRQLQSVEGDIARWGAEPAIVTAAQAAGLSQLGAPIRVAGR